MAGRTQTTGRDDGLRRSGPGSGPPPSGRQVRSGPRPPGRRLLRVAVLGPLVSVLLGGFALWVFHGSPWLRVEHVSVTGERALTREQVLEAAAVPVGAPLASVDTGAVERRLRGGLPRIDTVRVARVWPHGIVLDVVERRAVVVVEDGERYAEVDDEGVRFATAAERPEGVPLLVLDVAGSPTLRHFGPDRLRREAAEAVSALPGPLRRDVRGVEVRSYDSVVLELTRGRTVVWGSGEEDAAKAEALARLAKAARDAVRFDVSAPRAPAASGS